MKFLIVFASSLFVACTLAAPRPDTEIVKSVSDVRPDGYSFELQTSDGKLHHEDGVVKDLKDKEHAGIVVHGTYSWKDEHSDKVYTVTYVADENGYQPSGEHLPQQPKIVLH